MSVNKYYQLLNKDRIIAKFHIDGEGIFERIVVDYFDDRQPFIWINAGMLPTFIANRRAPNDRENIGRLLKKAGLDQISSYLDLTHALSLTDTLWVRNSNQLNLSWSDVNMYNKPFNSTIAKTAFDGGMYGYNLAAASPEYSTDGTFAKCWIREGGVIKMAKKGRSGASNVGLEPYSEFYTSKLFDDYGVIHAKYGLGRMGKDNSLVSKSELFTSEDIGLIPVYALKVNNLSDVIIRYREYGWVVDLVEMFVLDAVIFNQDRHLGNFGFLVDNNTGEILRHAPLYDHNLSLLCYASDSDISTLKNFELYSEKMNIGPKLYSGDFISFARQLLDALDSRESAIIKGKLINISNVKLKKHNKYNLSDYRLQSLEKLIHNQIKLILKK